MNRVESDLEKRTSPKLGHFYNLHVTYTKILVLTRQIEWYKTEPRFRLRNVRNSGFSVLKDPNFGHMQMIHHFKGFDDLSINKHRKPNFSVIFGRTARKHAFIWQKTKEF